MSFYNMMFGHNPNAPLLMTVLGLSDVGRYRDCYLSEDKTQIVVYTRNGGGNREEYQDVFDMLSLHPNYLYDEDDSFDCTYASIYFSIPDEYADMVKQLYVQSDDRPMKERFMEELNKLQSMSAEEIASDPRYSGIVDVLKSITQDKPAEGSDDVS